MTLFKRDYTYSIPWNLGLLTLGSFMAGFAISAVAVPHGMVTGGVSGLGMLLYYVTGRLSPAAWFVILNIPVFILGWLTVSRRFFFYSLYGMAVAAATIELVTFTAPIQDPMLAALAGGTLFGAGTGIALRSLGSTGGLDIIAVFLNNRWNLRIGQISFFFNLILLTCGMAFLDVDRTLFSMAMLFVSAMMADYFLSLFNQRKMVLVISDKHEAIAEAVLKIIHRGATYLDGTGAYTGEPKKVLLTVVNNLQLKRLEEAVYTIDPNAFTIIGNTFNVLGKRFSRRKVY